MARKSANYRRLEALWSASRPTILDGATGSELQAIGYPREVGGERPLNFTWGTLALYDAPELTRQLHRRYIDAGAHILETNTFLLHRLAQMERDGDMDVPHGTWQDKARLAVQLAREAAHEANRDDVVVAFSLEVSVSPKSEWMWNGPTAKATRPPMPKEILSLDYLRALVEALRDQPPDALLVELAPDPPSDLAMPYYEVLLASELPLWIAFRRGALGKLSITGDVMQDDRALFAQAVERLEEMGISAILAMCAPAESLRGLAAWLRQYTQLPLGVYPNNGQYDMWQWRWEQVLTPEAFAAHARGFAEEGMNIIGGCCGTRPDDIAAVWKALATESARAS
ncbi:MAG TPA: homocysteine S-methyltransferase family protein [Chloroflexota bacterium]|nr:homocysteine S-methyltransferase family protein [Chloroflexota bacterium]